MGRVIGFSELPQYLNSLGLPPERRATILDSNILITLTYDVRDDYEDVCGAVQVLEESGYRLFATVNTKAEYLEYQRRIVLTEALLDAVDEHSDIKLPRKAKARISTLKGSIKTAAQADPDRDIIFGDVHLKKIKREFSAGNHSGKIGWMEFCTEFLAGKLQAIENGLERSGIEYVSQHQPSQKDIFHSLIDWPDAMRVCETTGASFSDSMILNAFRCSHCPFIVSRDFDIGYAVLADKGLKDAIMPDRMAREYRHYHFSAREH